VFRLLSHHFFGGSAFICLVLAAGVGYARAETERPISNSIHSSVDNGVDNSEAVSRASAPQQVVLKADPNKAPVDLVDVGIEEHIGETLDFSKLNFINEAGQAVSLQSSFDGKLPVFLNLVYYECPMLCTLVLNNLMDSLSGLNLKLGQDYRLVTVSIDPNDTAKIAAQKKINYFQQYWPDLSGDTDAILENEGWRFYTGQEPAIQALASQVGFLYKYVGGDDKYAHPAITYALTPDGKISRYLYGAHYKPMDLRFAIVEAGRGNVGNVIDRFLMFCYHYEPTRRGYVLSAVRLMQLGGLLTVLFVAFFIGGFWLQQRKELRA
jgi:protein SCO1/2